MKKARKVRVGFVGVGAMGQCAHLRNFVNLPDCEVAAIAELRPALAAAVAARYGVPRVYANHREMLAAEKLDAVVASQPFSVHATLLPELYGRVKYVFTEKPLAVGVKAGARLARLAARRKTVHMVGYHKRSDPATVYARQVSEGWRRSGEMGALKYVRLTMPAGDWIAEGFQDLIRSDEPVPELEREAPPDDVGGDVQAYVSFVNYYIHQVNLMRHLLGEPYRVTFADAAGVLLAVQGRSGATGVIEMTPYRTTIEWEETALVAFERGYVRLELPAPLAASRPGRVEVYRDPAKGRVPERLVPTLGWIHAMRQQAANFIRVCQGKMAPPCDAAEAVEDLRVARDYIRRWRGK